MWPSRSGLMKLLRWLSSWRALRLDIRTRAVKVALSAHTHPSAPPLGRAATMATTLAASASLCHAVSLSGKRARCPVGARKALAAAPARVNRVRNVAARAVQEIAGADFESEVLKVRPPPRPSTRSSPSRARARHNPLSFVREPFRSCRPTRTATDLRPFLSRARSATAVRRSRARGFLGHLVRPLQAHQQGGREGGGGVFRGHAQNRQDRGGPQPRAGGEVRGVRPPPPSSSSRMETWWRAARERGRSTCPS